MVKLDFNDFVASGSGLSLLLFESGPIRTQVCLRTERACKQTNQIKSCHFFKWALRCSDRGEINNENTLNAHLKQNKNKN